MAAEEVNQVMALEDPSVTRVDFHPTEKDPHMQNKPSKASATTASVPVRRRKRSKPPSFLAEQLLWLWSIFATYFPSASWRKIFTSPKSGLLEQLMDQRATTSFFLTFFSAISAVFTISAREVSF